ncbi:MAG: RNA polymerase sigma factor RpoE [Nitrosospira sp.]|nr:RNA polymerase sigma factor RpoE [Nitrosospira sp.]MDW7642282.1 RNA polymerase sigma factor RpoE [Nitrosomonadaceae bacterium]MBI0408044.1 RNA polymerase sigma factor RpoE [Nitrosospira sp.]MBI0414017.1 RNA polymerase sigma factor RpoE [Nitrosospira sp.]MBI0416846.1 RNA polymerase sigma factor RpoE [Nitrosospira sp.]
MNDRKIDQKLVELAQYGDKKAFDLLVIKYRGRLIRVLSRFIRDSTEVEDVAQETFIKAYLALSSFRGESAFYTWLYRVGVNTAKNFLTIRGREVIDRNITYDISDSEGLETNNLFQDWKTPERELINKQLAQTIKRALENLPKELYTTITLREIEGLSYEEIANVMSCPIGTVRSRIFRARDLILSELGPILADK